MNPFDLLIAEYRLAYDQFKSFGELKIKFLGIYLAVLGLAVPLLFQLIPRGTGYLAMASLIVFIGAAHSYINHKVRQGWYVLVLSEHKLNKLAQSEGVPKDYELSFCRDFRRFRNPYGRRQIRERVMGILNYSLLLLAYATFAALGIRAVGLSTAARTALGCAFALLPIGVFAVGLHRNKVAKAAFRQLESSRRFTGVTVDGS